jgi:hypothetical protein
MENKTSKYLKYAIGEIFLVVIGILIAVIINSKYNAAQNETKIKAILTQVQQDLVTDIIDAKRIFNIHIHKDSLFRKIMNDSITLEVYKKNPYPLRITRNYVSFSTKKGGYNRFINNLENLPEKYNDLLPFFNTLYVEMQNDIDDYNLFIKNTVMIDGREDAKTNPKFADYNWGRYPDEALEYYFKDPFLKNKTSIYINDLGNISRAANDYRIESIILYKKIDSLLGQTEIVYLEPLTVIPEKETIKSFLGDYKELFGEFENSFSVTIENDQLVVKTPNQPVEKLYWNEGEYFFIKENDAIIRLYKNKQDEHFLELSSKNFKSKFEKIKDL